MTTNQNRGDAVKRYDPACPCERFVPRMISATEGDYVEHSDYAALQLRVTSLEAALMGFLRYFQSGNPIPVERATIMANSEAVRFAESILPPSGPQEA